MTRTLLLEELKRTFVPGMLAAIVGVLMTVATKPMVARYVGGGERGAATTLVFVAFLLVVAASAAGSAAFSQQFRDGPLRLLENLPIARLRIWFIRFLVSLATFVCTVGLFVLAHPSLLSSGQDLFLIGASFGFLLFAGGTCWGVIVQAGSAAIALLNLFLASTITVLLLAMVQVTAEEHARFVEISVYAAFFSIPILIMGPVFFLIGEFDVRRRRLINDVFAAAVLFLVAIATVLVCDSGALASSEKWITLHSIRAWAQSPDNRYLGILAQRASHGFLTKAVVVDVESGKIVTSFEQKGLNGLFWTKSGSLFVLSNGGIAERILGIGNSTARVTEVFPNEKAILRRSRSEAVSGIDSAQWGTFVAVDTAYPLQRWKGTTSVLRLESSGTFENVLELPWDVRSNPPDLIPVPNGLLFQTYKGRRLQTAWLIGERVRNVTYNWGPLYFSNADESKPVLEALLKTAPRDAASKVAGVFLYSESDYLFDNNSWIYFREIDASTRKARLLGRRKNEREWKVAIPETSLEQYASIQRLLQGGDSRWAPSLGLWVGARSGLALQVSQAGSNPKIFLANLKTGESFEFIKIGLEEGEDLRQISAIQDGDTFTIFVSRFRKGRPGGPSMRFLYQPGKGTLTPLPAATTPSVTKRRRLFKGPAGIEVTENSETFVAELPNGTTRQLWPQ